MSLSSGLFLSSSESTVVRLYVGVDFISHCTTITATTTSSSSSSLGSDISLDRWASKWSVYRHQHERLY